MFTIFMDLPLELRLEIWQYALPTVDLPGLAIYKKGCWQPRFLTPSDWDYYEGDPDNIRFEFRYELLPVSLEVPMMFVNHEARNVALSWLQRSGIRMRCNNGQSYFQRPMNHNIDALYLPIDKLEEFDTEPSDRQFEEDMINRHVGVVPYLRHFAISEEFFNSSEFFLEGLDWFIHLETIYVVIGQQPDDHGHWEIVDIGERPIIWGVERGFEMGDGGTILNHDLCQRILADNNGLGESFRFTHSPDWSLAIQLVIVVKK
ncbi:hypothetical protein ACHAO9_003337 [Fusarium lateritium]